MTFSGVVMVVLWIVYSGMFVSLLAGVVFGVC